MNSSFLKKIVTLSSALTLLFFFMISTQVVAHAQSIGNTSLDGIDIALTPLNPAPGDSVTVSVDSYSTDLDNAAITWYIGGKAYAKGNGLKSIDITAPAVGKSMQVIASIITAEKASIQKTVTIRSGDVDLVWESSGYLPPFYQGKVAAANQNTMKFIAIPHFVSKTGTPIDPKTLVYQWSNGSDAFGDQSGYGKQSLVVPSNIIPQPLAINVQVTSATDPNVGGEAALTITPQSPSILFYQDDPLYGILYNSAIGKSFRLFHNEVKIAAAPFGFDVNDSSLLYNWNINNILQNSLTASRSIVLRVNSGQQGSSDVNLSMANQGNRILQSATADFRAIFNTTAESSSTVSF